jgi:hypothetical protein
MSTLQIREVDVDRSRYSPGIIAAIVILVVVVLILLALTIYFGIKSSNNTGATNNNTTISFTGATGPQGPTGATGAQGATGAGFNLGDGIRPFRFTHNFRLEQTPYTRIIPLNQVFDNFTTIYEVTINTTAFNGFNRRYVIPPSGPLGNSIQAEAVPLRYDTFIRDNNLHVNFYFHNPGEIMVGQELTLQLLAFSRPLVY